MANKTKTISPLRTSHFGLAQHKFQRFNAIVPGGLVGKDLENPTLWVNIASKLNVHDEIRAIAEDSSFVATLIVTFVNGSDVRVKVIQGVSLDEVDSEAILKEDEYYTKLRGPKKWCVMKRSTNEVLKSDIPTQVEAMKELNDYLMALRS